MRAGALICVLAAALAAALAAPAAAGAPATKTPGQLLVGLSLAAPPFQAGSVRGREVVLAKGYEIDVARALARRLGLRRVRFVNEPSRERLAAAGRKVWDVALARVALTKARARAVGLSEPYLRGDQVVLLRRGLSVVRRLSALRPLELCAERGSRAADVIAGRIRPRSRALYFENVDALGRALQTGRCDAAVGDLASVGSLVRQNRSRFGPVAGRIETVVAYAVVLEKGSPLLAEVDRSLRRLAADGTLGRLAKAWLGLNPSRLPLLR